MLVKIINAIFTRNMDYEYVAKREAENDKYWTNYEKDFYYYKYNENYILPTILFCVIALFTSPIYIGIFGCIVLVIGALFLCHCNNVNLDNNPSIQQKRKQIREFREKHGDETKKAVEEIMNMRK